MRKSKNLQYKDRIKELPFKVVNLEENDIEILLDTEINQELLYMPTKNNGGILICSHADSDAGMGNLFSVDFMDIVELGRWDDDEDDGLYIITKTTEGQRKISIFDFRPILK